MTEEIEVFLALAESHSSSIETLRQCLSPLRSAEDYMTELQWRTYMRLREILEDQDREVRVRALRLRRPLPPW